MQRADQLLEDTDLPIDRVAGDADRARRAEIVRVAFGSEVEVDLVEAIRRSPGYLPDLSLVAEADGVVVGHAMVSHALVEGGSREHRVATLSPLAVAPDRQRQERDRARPRRDGASGCPRRAGRRPRGEPRLRRAPRVQPSAAHGTLMDVLRARRSAWA